VKYSISTD